MKKFLLALSLCASTALVAGEADYNWEFTPTIGGVTPEGDTGLKNSFVYGLRAAKNIENSWINQVELGYDRVSNFKIKDSSSKTKQNLYALNVVKNIVDNDNFKLYGLVGAGYMDFAKNYNDLDGFFGQYGLGAKYYWTDNFATKLEVRDAYNFKEKEHFLYYTLGLAVDFGKRNIAPEPVAQQIGDEDGDGVLDNVDRCPGTPRGVVVDEYGCEKVIRLDLGVNFAFDSSEINSTYSDKIQSVANFMSEHPDYSVRLEGNTDSRGSDEYNQKLSERRAAAVAKALMHFGVSADKITTVGLGEKNPIASNDTDAGRAQNRRVDAKFRK